MIVLDTDVVSETLKPAPSELVRIWLGAQERTHLFVTTVTQAEIFCGLESLASGRRKSRLSEAIEKVFSEFHDRVLAFDEPSARVYANIMALRRQLGRPISKNGAMIAAIAHSHGADVATRDAAGFEHCRVKVLNPWQQ